LKIGPERPDTPFIAIQDRVHLQPVLHPSPVKVQHLPRSADAMRITDLFFIGFLVLSGCLEKTEMDAV
jgi:hypothetical protein